MEYKKIHPKYYLTTKSVFITSLVVAILVILGIWLLRIGKNRTLFENSLLSTSILSTAFFLFLFFGLYYGIKLKENLGSITDRINADKIPTLDGMDFHGGDGVPSVDGDGIGGIILGIIVWLLASVVLVFVITFLGAMLWILILVFTAMLYWIFFRALRFVFKNSPKTRQNLSLSLQYALFYTFLYNCWIYGVILATHYLM